MKLLTSTTSPFVRKVLVLAHEAGLADRLTRHDVLTSPTAPDDSLLAANPLAKLPALVLDDGGTLYDSRVICEYLDGLHGRPRFLPEAGPARWSVLRRQALADGLLDAGILVRYEHVLRPEALRWSSWTAAQALKVTHALDALEAEARAPRGDAAVDLGDIATGCALGWLEFRNPLPDVRVRRPALFAWYDAFRERPSMRATEPC